MILGVLVLSLDYAAFCQEPSSVEFQRDIRPLLSDRCFACHGPDPAGRNSELRLDSPEAAFRDLGGYSAIVPGDLDASELIYRITTTDQDDRMPKSGLGLSLSPSEIELFKTWVRQGAVFTPHWAFEPPKSPVPPLVRDAGWPRDPLDNFVLKRLEQAGHIPSEEAEPLVWLRRVHFALIGLPPTAKEAREFLADDLPNAHEKVVDRLLASPHFGERMAQPWLDLARYADTYGYQSDVGTRVWPFRDWVIRAFNENLPYDQFLRWQLAGDLIPDASPDQRVATAFNRLHRQTNEGGSVAEEYRVEYVNDRVQTFGTAFMGLTLECASCHDHRYDPISQKEYYQLSAFFDDIDESGLYSHFTSATPTPAMDLPTPAQAKALADMIAKVENEKKAVGGGKVPTFSPEDATARFTFDDREDLTTVESPQGKAVVLDGDTGVRLKGAGAWSRSDPFSISVALKADRHFDRAVVLHRSRAWTDAGSQGWQILIEDGRLLFALVHFWPGNAVAIKSKEAVPMNEWVKITVTSDGSSRAQGLQVHFDEVQQDCEVVRDSLTRTIMGGGPGDPTLGERFRDSGFAGGLVDEVVFFDHALNNPALAQLRDARKKRNSAQDAIPQLMVMEDKPQPRPTFLLERGSYQDRGEIVDTATPLFLGGVPIKEGSNRVDLADWLLAEEHPLTARVEADRTWRAVFGMGLVRTPENFGSQGRPPTHPELLDFLSTELRSSGWDRKALLKRLVLSATFRQSSATTPENWAADPENTLWARGPSFTLPAEMLRDNALHASGLLVPKVGGPSVLPYQPPGLWSDKGSARYSPSKGEGLYRRSLYTYWKRTSPPPSMVILDSAKRDVCVARRQSTNTPLQALVLWNDPQFGEAARVLAAALCREEFPLEEAFLRLAGRLPREREALALDQLFKTERTAFQKDLSRAEALLSIGEAPVPEDLPVADHAAWSLVCSALMASDPVTVLR